MTTSERSRDREASRLGRLGAWLGPVVVAVVGLAALAWNWGRWPDVVVDFGRELYTPWQLAQGKVLYVDLEHFNGPLSQYLNALWFWVFGASLRNLVVLNLLLLAALTAMCYGLLTEIGSRLSATIACLTFVVLFGLGQFVRIGNYNFLCPYSHEITHGVILSVAAIYSLKCYLQRRHVAWLAATGFVVGLLFLTKAETFLAGGVATLVGLGLMLWAESARWRRATALTGVFLCAAAAPVLGAFGLLCTAMPARTALRGVLGTWWYVFRHDPASLPFYRAGLGSKSTGQSVMAMLEWTGVYLALLVAAGAVALFVRRRRRVGMLAAGGAFIAVVALLWANWPRIAWQEALRPFPLLMLGLGAASFATFRRQRHDVARAQRAILACTLTVFGFVLLLKMIFNVRLYHYGFALAMPAALVLIVAMLDWAPAVVARLGGHRPVFLAAALGAWLVATCVHVRVMAAYYGRKTHPVGQGADRILADERGIVVQGALDEIQRRLAPGQTLAALPEGVILNYLARRENPTPYINFMPLELVIFDEARILDAFRGHPPDVIALIHKDTSEYGLRFFGTDYGQQLCGWVLANYTPVALFGAEPFRGPRFGIKLYQRNRTP